VLPNCIFDRFRVDKSRANAARLNGSPTVAAAIFIFFLDEIAPITTVEVPHRGVSFLNPFKEM